MAANRMMSSGVVNRLGAGVVALGAVLGWGCQEEPGREGFERVKLDGRVFELELAADEPKRERGLSYRESIPEDGGMLFVFPDAQTRGFWMYDCYVPIDIVFLDASGRVTATHHMPTDRRKEGETEDAYRGRLSRYSSRFAAQFAIELKGGMLEGLSIEEGEVVGLDLERLKALAR